VSADPEPSVISFYRVDQSRRIRRVLVVGAGLIVLGATVMAVSFLTRSSEDVRRMATTVGLACTVAGGLSAVIGMSRALREDTCLVVRTDGLMMQSEGRESLFRWADIERIRLGEDARTIVVVRADGSEITVADRPFAGTETKALAQELDGMRRKAAWNLLPG
jgi:hypothetical protein